MLAYFWWKNTCGQKPTFISYFYIYYIYFIILKRKKTGKLTKNPYKWLNHAGLRVFQNWPKTDHLPTFSDHLATFVQAKNIKSTAWTEIFDHCPLFLTKNWPQKYRNFTTKTQKRKGPVKLLLILLYFIREYVFLATRFSRLNIASTVSSVPTSLL